MEMSWKWHVAGCAARPNPSVLTKFDYFRVPKTGSMMLIPLLQQQQCTERLTVHDHSHCCSDSSWCNGAAFDERGAFAVLREPCERFVSQLDHMRRVDYARFGRMAPLDFARFLWQATGNGTCADAQCRTREVSIAYRSRHRFILWPQAFYLPPSGDVVCYHQEHLRARLAHFLWARSICDVRGALAGTHRVNDKFSTQLAPNATHFSDVQRTDVCAHVARIFPEDVMLWDLHCGVSHDERPHPASALGRVRRGGML